MATYINGDYPNLENYTPGLRIEEVPKISGNFIKDASRWLIKNAKRINVLNIYCFSGSIFLYAVLYRIFNPNGKIYLKFDGNQTPAAMKKVKLWKGILSRLQIKLCYCASTEFSENAVSLSKLWKRGIIYVPNPLNPNEVRDYKPFNERQNLIITMGRLGTRQKATEVLLEAFVVISSQIPDWKLKLVGHIEENMNIAGDFYAKYPDLSERVIFTGEVRDHEELIKLYRTSKIFAFPSRYESFGIALTEAMSHGCFAVTSDIPSSRSLTENFRFGLGSKVNDVKELAENLL